MFNVYLTLAVCAVVGLTIYVWINHTGRGIGN